MIYTFVMGPNLSVGYTQASVNYIKALQTQNIDFTLRPLGNVLNWRDAPFWTEGMGDYFIGSSMETELNIVQMTPAQLCEAPIWNGAANIAFTTFETTRIPKWIGEKLNTKYRGVLVPSQFNKEALAASGVTIPIHVVEHAIGDWWKPNEDALKEKSETYIFGYVGAWNERKNPKAVLAAYLEAFPEDNGETALFLKTVANKGLESFVEHEFIKGREDIWLYNELWTEEQMLWAHTLFDCYVSAHRGEGFGLGLAQSALLGKPVIYTSYSAPSEWLGTDATHLALPYETVKVQGIANEFNLHFEGETLEWADPSHEALVKAMRRFKTMKPKPSPQATRNLRERLSWEKVGQDFVNAIESILGRELPRKKESPQT